MYTNILTYYFFDLVIEDRQRYLHLLMDQLADCPRLRQRVVLHINTYSTYSFLLEFYVLWPNTPLAPPLLFENHPIYSKNSQQSISMRKLVVYYEVSTCNFSSGTVVSFSQSTFLINSVKEQISRVGTYLYYFSMYSQLVMNQLQNSLDGLTTYLGVDA